MTLINYYKETIRFVNSLVIKIDEIRIHQNYHTYVKYGRTPPDLLNSKYYQNISGSLNINDIPVILNDGTELSREILITNIYLKSTLLKYDTTYNNLILNNPGMSDYIRGCLIDINIKDLIELDNYSIISYNKNLLQENETVLLLDIENYVSKFMINYNNNKFMVDELYLPALLSNLYSSLILFVISKRFNNIKTNRVDHFHLEKHLMSYKYLYNDSRIFDLPTNIYLYGNIDRLKHRLGRNKILEEYMTKVYDRNNIGIGLLKMHRIKPTIIENNFNDISKEFYNSSYKINVSPANDSLYNIRNKEFDLGNLNKLLLDNKIGNPYENNDMVKLDKELTINNKVNKSNIFIIDEPEKIRINENNNFIFLLSNLIDNFNTNKLKYTFTLDYYNIKNFKLYKLTIKDILNIIVFNLYKINNISSTEFSIVCNNVFNNKVLKSYILQKTWYKNRIEPIYDYLINNKNLYIPIINLDTLKLYLSAVRGMDAKVWFALSNIVDNTAKVDISTISSLLFNNRELSFNIDNIILELKNNSLDAFINNFGLDILTDLIEKISGIPVDETKLIKNKMFHMRSFFNKTTSYTIDLIIDDNFIKKEIINSGEIDVNLGYKPFIQINDISFKLYEELNMYIISSGFIDQEVTIYNPNINTVDTTGYTKSLPLMTNYNNYSLPYITGKSRKLHGKLFLQALKFKSIIDNSIVNSEEKTLLNVVRIKRYMPVNVMGNNEIDDVVYLQGNVDIKYKGKPYRLSAVSTFNNQVTDNINNIENANNLTIKTEKVINVSVMEELNTLYVNSLKDGIRRNTYKPDVGIKDITDRNITNIKNDKFLDTSCVKLYLPVNSIENTPISDVVYLQGNVGIKYRGKPYRLSSVKAFNNQVTDNINNIDNTNNIGLRTERLIKMSVMEELNTLYVKSLKDGIRRNTYKPDVGVKDITDRNITNIKNDKFLDISCVKLYLPVNSIENTPISDTVILQGNVGIKYKGVPYKLSSVKTFNKGDETIIGIDNINNIGLRTERLIKMSIMEELNTMYIESTNNNLNKPYKSNIKINDVSDDSLNTKDELVATVIKSGKIGSIKVMPYDNIEDGIETTILTT